MPGGRRAALLVAVAALLAGCGRGPFPDTTPASSASPTDSPIAAPTDGGPDPLGAPIELDGRDAGFALVLLIASDVVDAGQPIDMSAVLTWEGSEPTATVWGSGSGPVTFSLVQLDGDITLGGIQTADCGSTEFRRFVPVPVPYRKSGGFSDDDPNAGFYRTFFADPLLRLPAGRWRVAATASGDLEPCAMDAPKLSITVEAELLVR